MIVAVAIEQAGCCERSRPTSQGDPVDLDHGVIHYCVTNMPGAVPRTSAFALNNATLPFVRAMADNGVMAALADDPHLLAGLNVHGGEITHAAVAESLGLPPKPARAAIG